MSLLLLASFAFPSTFLKAQSTSLSSAADIYRNKVRDEYGKLPLSFEPAINGSEEFVARTAGGSVQLTGKGMEISLLRPATSAQTGSQKAPAQPLRLQVRLDGANPAIHAQAIGELPGKTNYFTGANPAGWRTNVQNFSRIEYSGIYAGIDLIYYGDRSGHLEHDFVVKPGADPATIRFTVAGAKSLDLAKNGDLQIALAHAAQQETATLRQPVIYQEIGGIRVPIDGGYILAGPEQLGFRIGTYDRSKELVIDPVLDYSTFLGGGVLTGAYGIAVDEGGNAYVVGHSGVEGSFPTTKGAYDTSCDDCSAAFVAKLNPTGTALVYSTYLASGLFASAASVAVDKTGAAYVVGDTSSGFPVTKGAVQTKYGGAFSNAFVTKLNPSGSALDYSTYLGGDGPSTCYTEASGSKSDLAMGIAIDASGNAYVTGCAASTNFPVTKGAFETSCAGCEAGYASAFAAKLNTTGTELLYSTFLGGDRLDIGYGIAVNSGGSAFVAGSTTSTNLKVSSSAYQKHIGGSGAQNAFVAKLSSSGAGVDYYTYLGGSLVDGAYAIALNSAGNGYVAGYASSDNFPTTKGAYQTSCHDCDGSQTGFVTELNSAGSGLAFSTFLGGSTFDALAGVGVDSKNNVYVTGITQSTNFPTTSSAYKKTCPQCSANSGESSAVFAELNSAGTGLSYSTYLGGTSSDNATALAMDTGGNAYVVGQAASYNFPVSAAAVQQTCAACEDNETAAFVTKFYNGSSTPSLSFSPTSLSFGNQALKQASKALSLTLKNSGQAPLAIDGFKVAGTDPADFGGNQNCGVAIPPGVSCAAAVSFTPAALGSRSALLEVIDNESGSPQSVKLGGTGVEPEPIAAFSPTSIDFGKVKLNTVAVETVTLKNTGTANLKITADSITGSGEANFGANTTCAGNIAPGSSCTFTVGFDPTQKQYYYADLNVTTNASSTSVKIALGGEGVAD